MRSIKHKVFIFKLVPDNHIVEVQVDMNEDGSFARGDTKRNCT